MSIKEKTLSLFYTWRFIFNYFFRPWKIESEIVSKVTTQERRSYHSQIDNLKLVVKTQQMECQALHERLDRTADRLLELTDALAKK